MNPFIYNEPVRIAEFINREEICNRVLQETINRRTHGNVWIIGERQVGKTSLLRYIQITSDNLKEQVEVYGADYSYYVSALYTNVQDCDTREKFYQNLRQVLKNRFDFKLKNQKDSMQALKKALQYVFDKRYFTLFLIDEFDAFLQNLINRDATGTSTVSFLHELNKLFSSPDFIPHSLKAFSCILAANSSYSEILKLINASKELGSGLIAHNIDIDWFTRKQVKQLAALYLKNNPVKFTSKEIDYCYQLTKGYPYLVQRLFSVMYDKKVKKVSRKNFKQIIKKEYADILKQTIVTWGRRKCLKGLKINY